MVLLGLMDPQGTRQRPHYPILQEIEETYCEIPSIVSPQFSAVADLIRSMYGYSSP